MPKLFIVLRVIRNIFVAVVSVVWIYPFYMVATAVLDVMALQEADLAKTHFGFEKGGYFSAIELAQWILPVGAILLTVVVAFWAFVAANRIWPIERKQTKNS